MPPQSPHQPARIDLLDLKAQIGKRLGHERFQLYFSYLSRLLAHKMSKHEFSKRCFVILGRENIPLHNQLIRSILKNACQAQSPPPFTVGENVSKKIGPAMKLFPHGNDPQASVPHSLIRCNGDIIPPSPRKSRSSFRDRRFKDRPSPLGPNGRVEVSAHRSLLPSDDSALKENGIMGPCDLMRPVQHHQSGPAEQPASKTEEEKQSPDQFSMRNNGLLEVFAGKDMADEGEKGYVDATRRPLRAPLGIPFYPASMGGARRSLPLASSSANVDCTYESGELCNNETLTKRMEKIAVLHGVGGVSLDCASLLNKGLDVYLKRLIKSGMELARTRAVNESMKLPFLTQQSLGKPINGIWPGNPMHIQSSGYEVIDYKHGIRNHYVISLQDLKVATELNPQQLGEDWPLLLEKISSIHTCEE
ncbi:hypothetical protein AXF42_Ash001835 [Apostasia shenzhenica]|uniref:Transcriptional coactivator Hfi1/Transcriptional adapter 1 n=1 Tax=Apostasia shenzhenica TaxID=1088818 RepID=A0A2I0ABD5_9ASPA|nr:hypothetical protein AXF42_Ash001835 [Apostasia shenzhenica]